MDKHYWLRCSHQGRKWITTFADDDDRHAIVRGRMKLEKLADGNRVGMSDLERRQADDWNRGDVELVNEVGVVLNEYGGHGGR
jgi:hypothetical protein